MTIWFLIVLFVLVSSIPLFVSKELFKKFGFAKEFALSSKQVVHWKYVGDKPAGMYNIVLQSAEEFSVLIGFLLPLFKWIGYDWFGFAKSDNSQKIVICTYLNHKPTEFVFLINKNVHVNISSTIENQQLQPHVTYKPHWWQKIGIINFSFLKNKLLEY